MSFGERKNQTTNQTNFLRFQFVGRHSEIIQFMENFYLQSNDFNKRPIVSISGIGGVGKTTFIKHIIKNLPPNTLVSYVDETNQIGDNIARLLETICRNARIGAQTVSFPETMGAIRKYDELLKEFQIGGKEIPKEFLEIIYSASRLALSGTVVGPIMDSLELKESLPSAITFLSNQFRNITKAKDDLNVLVDPKTVLTKHFVNDLNRIAGGKSKTVLFFDTYEVIGPSVNPWVLKYLIGDERENIDSNLHLVASGRAPLVSTNEYWYPWFRENYILELELSPFTNKEIVEYVQVNITDWEAIDVEKLANLTARLPLWIELWAMSDKKTSEYSSATDLHNVEERIMKFLPSDLHRQWVTYVAVCNWFDQDVLEVSISKDNAIIAFEWLTSQAALVRNSSNGRWKLHDTLSDVLQRYLKTTSPENWDNINHNLALYFLSRASARSKSFSTTRLKCFDDIWQSHVLNALYYFQKMILLDKCLVDIFIGFMCEALNFDISFFYSLSDLNETVAEPKLPDLRGLWLEGRFTIFADKLQLLVKECSLSDEQIAIAYNWIGYAFEKRQEWTLALDWYEKAIQIDRDLASVYYDKGNVLEMLGATAEANEIYKMGAMKLAQEADIFNRDYRFESDKRLLIIGRAMQALGYSQWMLEGKGGLGKATSANELANLLIVEDDAYTYKRNSLFSKERPTSENVINLHDKLEEMIHTYVWEKRNPTVINRNFQNQKHHKNKKSKQSPKK